MNGWLAGYTTIPGYNNNNYDLTFKWWTHNGSVLPSFNVVSGTDCTLMLPPGYHMEAICHILAAGNHCSIGHNTAIFDSRDMRWALYNPLAIDTTLRVCCILQLAMLLVTWQLLLLLLLALSGSHLVVLPVKWTTDICNWNFCPKIWKLKSFWHSN